MQNVQYRLNAPACISEAVEDDLIVINLNTGRYYNMRRETVVVWKALTQGVTASDLISANTWDSDQIACFNRCFQYLLDEQLLVPQSVTATEVHAPKIDLNDSQGVFHVDVFTDMEEMLLLDPIHDASDDTGWPQKA